MRALEYVVHCLCVLALALVFALSLEGVGAFDAKKKAPPGPEARTGLPSSITWAEVELNTWYCCLGRKRLTVLPPDLPPDPYGSLGGFGGRLELGP